FFGAASALARSENLGVAFFADMLSAKVRPVVDSVSAMLVTVIAGYVAFNAIKLGGLTSGQTTGSGLPLELTFYPMGIGALFMTAFAHDNFRARPVRDAIAGVVATALIAGLYLAWDFLSPASVPSSGTLMLIGFFITLFGGLPIGFALALAALIFIWVEGTLPGVIFAQQMARGIDNFVLLAIPFFILVGYLMEANGMSVLLIELPGRAAEAEPRAAVSGLWSGTIASFGLIFMIFFGFKSGFATATEISAFAVVYAIIVGSIVFRDLSFRTAAHSFVQSATRSGLVL